MAEGDGNEGSKFRDYRGTEGQVEDADPVTPPDERRRNARGRIGASRPKSPRPAVRDPGPAREGTEGEPAYGADTSVKPVQTEESEKRKVAKPDPLKPKKKDDKKE